MDRFRAEQAAVRESFARAFATPEVQRGGKARIVRGFRSNWQWADRGHNIIDPHTACPNACLYCYVAPMNARFGRETEVADMEDIALRPVKAMGRARQPKLIMFPTTHDLFPSIVREAIEAVQGLLKAGHEVLIVSKPRIAVVQALCAALAEAAPRVEFRFTISTDRPEIMAKWEPRAPGYEERLQCLREARDAGFRVSVSMEPFLSDPAPVIERVRPHADTIWLGLMNHSHHFEDYEELAPLYTREAVEPIVRRYIGDPQIHWKESVMSLFIRFQRPPKEP